MLYLNSSCQSSIPYLPSIHISFFLYNFFLFLCYNLSTFSVSTKSGSTNQEFKPLTCPITSTLFLTIIFVFLFYYDTVALGIPSAFVRMLIKEFTYLFTHQFILGHSDRYSITECGFLIKQNDLLSTELVTGCQTSFCKHSIKECLV